MVRSQHTEIGDSHRRSGLHTGHTTRHRDADIPCGRFARSRSRIAGIRSRLKREHDHDDSNSIANRQLGRALHDLAGHLFRRCRAAGVRMRDLDTTPPMQFYSPLWQTPTGSVAVVVRGTLPPEPTASALRGLVRNADAALAVADVRTMEQLVSEASAERRFQTLVLTVFGGISLFLSLLGLYALMAYSVQRRTAEIGIRMALGAQRSAVMGLVLRCTEYAISAYRPS